MESATEIINATIEQVKSVLTSGRVVGDPIQVGEATIIPLVSVGFGFGGGSGSGDDGKNTDGAGRGAGAGGGVKPVALVIADANGVRVEAVDSKLSGLASSISEIVKTVMEKHADSEKKSADETDAE